MKVPLPDYFFNKLKNEPLPEITPEEVAATLERVEFELIQERKDEILAKFEHETSKHTLHEGFKTPMLFGGRKCNITFTPKLLSVPSTPKTPRSPKTPRTPGSRRYGPSTAATPSLSQRSFSSDGFLIETPIVLSALECLQHDVTANGQLPDILDFLDDDTKDTTAVENQILRYTEMELTDNNIVDYLLETTDEPKEREEPMKPKRPIVSVWTCLDESQPKRLATRRQYNYSKLTTAEMEQSLRRIQKEREKERKIERKERFSKDSGGSRRSCRGRNNEQTNDICDVPEISPESEEETEVFFRVKSIVDSTDESNFLNNNVQTDNKVNDLSDIDESVYPVEQETNKSPVITIDNKPEPTDDHDGGTDDPVKGKQLVFTLSVQFDDEDEDDQPVRKITRLQCREKRREQKKKRLERFTEKPKTSRTSIRHTTCKSDVPGVHEDPVEKNQHAMPVSVNLDDDDNDDSEDEPEQPTRKITRLLCKEIRREQRKKRLEQFKQKPKGTRRSTRDTAWESDASVEKEDKVKSKQHLVPVLVCVDEDEEDEDDDDVEEPTRKMTRLQCREKRREQRKRRQERFRRRPKCLRRRYRRTRRVKYY